MARWYSDYPDSYLSWNIISSFWYSMMVFYLKYFIHMTNMLIY